VKQGSGIRGQGSGARESWVVNRGGFDDLQVAEFAKKFAFRENLLKFVHPQVEFLSFFAPESIGGWVSSFLLSDAIGVFSASVRVRARLYQS